MTEPDEAKPADKPQSWWTTLPGVLTAVAGVIAAITALLAAGHAAGIWGVATTTSSTATTETHGTVTPDTSGTNSVTGTRTGTDEAVTTTTHEPQPPQPDPTDVLTSQSWTLRVRYIANGTTAQRSVDTYSNYLSTTHDDIAIKFVPSSSASGYDVIANGGGDSTKVDNVSPVADHPNQLSVVFQRTDFGNLTPGADCSRSFGPSSLGFDHGAKFDLTFDSARQTLGGPVWVARPDVGPPYICGHAEAISHSKLP